MGLGRKSSGGVHKVGIDMTPMIDCVFQLIIFFMLTLKIRADEGDFNINMPLGAPSAASSDTLTPEVKVRLVANPDGTLGQLMLGRRSLGNGEAAFARLNSEVFNLMGGNPNDPISKEMEVELDPDYELNYQEIVRAITAVSGRPDPVTKQPIRYIEKIKFAPPRAPRDGG